MAATKYLDYDGLLYFWTLIKGKLDLKADKATTYTKTEIDGMLSSAINYKGSVTSYSNLPVNPTVGDMYNVTETDENYIWAGAVGTEGQTGYVAAHWDPVGAIVNLVSITNSEIDTVVAS